MSTSGAVSSAEGSAADANASKDNSAVHVDIVRNNHDESSTSDRRQTDEKEDRETFAELERLELDDVESVIVARLERTLELVEREHGHLRSIGHLKDYQRSGVVRQLADVIGGMCLKLEGHVQKWTKLVAAVRKALNEVQLTVDRKLSDEAVQSGVTKERTSSNRPLGKVL